jgi:Helix-turn-helix domain
MESFNLPPSPLDPHLVRVAANPVRVGLLRLLATQETLSPREAIQRLETGHRLGLSQILYHVGVLQRYELVEPAGLPDRERGSLYRATARGQSVMAAIGLPKEAAD